MSAKGLSDGMARAFAELRRHPSVLESGQIGCVGECFEIFGDFEVPLPSRDNTRDLSSTGVQSVERVIFSFHRSFPLVAPKIYLRDDFNHELPHLNPISADGRVSPCVFFGDLDDLVNTSEGFSTLLNQVASWLRKAASNILIDARQGWEPLRRDHSGGVMIYDLDSLRMFVNSRSGSVVLPGLYEWSGSRCLSLLAGEKGYRPHRVPPPVEMIQFEAGAERGSFFTILAWADDSAIVDSYRVFSTETLGDVLTQADFFGSRKAVWEALQLVHAKCRDKSSSYTGKIGVVLVARRPCPLIADTSNLELLPYLIDVKETSPLHIPSDSSRSAALSHHEAISRALLQRLSGVTSKEGIGPIIQIGCGSVGSKVVLHLAREGHAPWVLIDRRWMMPHNYARHALYPQSPRSPYLVGKAEALKSAVESIGCRADAIPQDVVSVLSSEAEQSSAIPANARLLIDSTASTRVREVLAMPSVRQRLPRIVSMDLFGRGAAGVVLIEGESHNPCVTDLYDYAMLKMIENPIARSAVFQEAGAGIASVGQGCGSETMVMPDSLVSSFAAGAAICIERYLQADSPAAGEVYIGTSGKLSPSLEWQHHTLGPTIVLELPSLPGWRIHVLEPVMDLIREDALRWTPKESGAVLLGHISLSHRRITVEGQLPAPPDSIREVGQFVLGTSGLEDSVRRIQAQSGNYFSYVGTWHSHPVGGNASARDHAVLAKMAELRLGVPGLLLIWRPDSVAALADPGDL